MSKNSLDIRQKYIAKLLKKVDSLSEGVSLLGSVDRRILKKEIQKGGAHLRSLEEQQVQMGGGFRQRGGQDLNFKPVQQDALIARLKLKEQTDAIETARATIKSLNTNLSEVRSAITDLGELMKGLNYKFDPLEVANVPKTNIYASMILWNAYNNISWDKIEDTARLYSGMGLNDLLDNVKPSGKAEDHAKDEDKLKGGNKNDYELLLANLHPAPAAGVASVALSTTTSPDAGSGSAGLDSTTSAGSSKENEDAVVPGASGAPGAPGKKKYFF